MDSDYLRKHLGQCLVDCLSEVSQKRPHDPVEYMAQWLYKYIDNINVKQQETEEAAELALQIAAEAAEIDRQEKMKEEKARLAQEELERKKAEEAAAMALAAQAGLPPVREEESGAQDSAETQQPEDGDAEAPSGEGDKDKQQDTIEEEEAPADGEGEAAEGEEQVEKEQTAIDDKPPAITIEETTEPAEQTQETTENPE